LDLSLAKANGAYPYQPDLKGFQDSQTLQTLIGMPLTYCIQGDETLLEVAKLNDLGFYELHDLYPDIDPWIPPKGMELVLPTQWIIPEDRDYEIVINIPEFRMYYFMQSIQLIKTYPVGLGKTSWPTPVGTYKVHEKRKDPTWYIPESLQKKHGRSSMPPGPNNPLGKYWIGLGASDYGIHGTNISWSVGRPVTHGCIRLYRKDIETLYTLVDYGTSVKIIYEPVKIGFYNGDVFAEVHKDIYQRIGDLFEYTYLKLKEKKLLVRVDMARLSQALSEQNGLPVNISKKTAAESEFVLQEISQKKTEQ
jgi:L,D-transpeptidase ErfK/SrfK